MVIRKEDLADLDIIDSEELRSDGYLIYLTTTLVSTSSGSNLVTINLPSDGEGLITGLDHPVEPGDRVWLTGTTGADGYYLINTILTDTTFTVTTPIVNSTGGTIYFMYVSGSLKIGFDTLNYGANNVSHTNVQQAIEDLDSALANKINLNQHAALRQLIHLADGVGGLWEGLSGTYREITPNASPFPTSVIWYEDVTKTKKIVEKTIVFNSNKTVSSITWKVYDTDGTTILAQAIDNIVYSGVFEINRTRTII